MKQENTQPQNGKLSHQKDIICRLDSVTKSFGDHTVLENINLEIEKGKTTVIIGPSGCGKTVLIKHFIGLIRPTAGKVYFKNKRIDNLEENQLNKIRINFGYLFQEGALFDSLTVAENILFPVRQHYKTGEFSRMNELVKEKLAMVGLSGYQDYLPASLSGGQRKRVALARAVALNPEVILYDEPTTGLDPIRSDVINELILKLQESLSPTSVVVTHDMKSAYKISDRIIMLDKGRIIADGDANSIRESEHPRVGQFVNGQLDNDELENLKIGKTLNIE